MLLAPIVPVVEKGRYADWGKWIRWGTLLFLLPQLIVAEAIPGIKGQDNRELVAGNQPPRQAIGRIHKAGLGHCTGTLIAPDQVLTAAHCIWNTNTGKAIPGEYLHFVAGYHREGYLAASAVARVVHAPNYSLPAQVDLQAVEQDWALLVLQHPIHEVPSLAVTVRSAAELARSGSRQPLIQAGFSKDRPYILTVDRSCHIQGQVPGRELVAHDCDAIHGDSGSPILVETPQGMVVVAIHSATQFQGKSKERSIGLAVPTATVDFAALAKSTR